MDGIISPLKTDSLMEGSRVSTHKWIFAIYYEVSKYMGITTSELSRKLAITQSSAWYLRDRIREAFNTDQPPAEFESSKFFQLDVIRFQLKVQSSKTKVKNSSSDLPSQELAAICITELTSQLIWTDVILADELDSISNIVTGDHSKRS